MRFEGLYRFLTLQDADDFLLTRHRAHFETAVFRLCRAYNQDSDGTTFSRAVLGLEDYERVPRILQDRVEL